ncbi:MAG: hypothetical protein ACREJN_11485 [Nitrospiraceae bacterium]
MALTAETIFPIPGYLSNGFGAKKTQVVDVAGPNPYAAGGQLISASAFGMGGFDAGIGGFMSRSGTFYGRIQMAVPTEVAGTVPGGAASTLKLQWIVTATNVEAGALDLSQEVMRIVLIGV